MVDDYAYVGVDFQGDTNIIFPYGRILMIIWVSF